ncbi:hypothetical protein ACMD2_17115 [Ananas comosus]|uniref:Uncharacterized protein n=1 Tax=Ananas comosus TaxID=4615 RepID=A0A199UF80_ANACO|nr:hypothetical protein ACMD2_17115 [Ananas comosus]
MRSMLECAITLLRSRGGYGNVAESLASRIDELAKMRRMTLFAPDDLSAPTPLHLAILRLLVVPDRLLTHADLLRAPPGTELPSLHPRKRVAIKWGGAGIRAGSGFFRIREPDLAIIDERIAIHGVERSFLSHVPPMLLLESPLPGWEAAEGRGVCGAADAMQWIEAPGRAATIDLDDNDAP